MTIDPAIRRTLAPDQHCFREDNCSRHEAHLGDDCCCCGWLAAAHSGCDCDDADTADRDDESPTDLLPTALGVSGPPSSHIAVLEECFREAWRNVENGDPEAQTPADVAADIAQRLVDVYGVVTYPREDI